MIFKRRVIVFFGVFDESEEQQIHLLWILGVPSFLRGWFSFDSRGNGWVAQYLVCIFLGVFFTNDSKVLRVYLILGYTRQTLRTVRFFWVSEVCLILFIV